jgi:hypothetical protein
MAELCQKRLDLDLECNDLKAGIGHNGFYYDTAESDNLC